MKPAASAELARLEAEARFRRNRLALYRARVQSGSPTTSLPRLKELEREAELADRRLAAARITSA